MNGADGPAQSERTGSPESRVPREAPAGAPLPPVSEVLTDLGTGVWRWDQAADTVTLDAEAAQILGLPARRTTLTPAGIRSLFHPIDWNELDAVVRLALAEGTLAEARLRVMDDQGREKGVVRSRARPVRHTGSDTYELVGIIQKVAEAAPGPASQSPVTGDWRRSREAFLLDAGRALAEAQSTEEVLRVAAGLSMPGFTPDGLILFGVEGDRLSIIGHYGQSESSTEPFSEMPLHTDYPATEVVRTGRAIYLSSPREYQRRYPAVWPLVAGLNRHSWAFLPLAVGGHAIGAWLAAFAYPVQFTPDERSVLTTVARMLAQALSRAGVADSERELAQGLQRSMMPTLGPHIPGMEVAARYVPTGGGLQVGGDWYDMITLPSGRIALVIGDVQGHDVRAAGLMGQLRIALRAYASEGHRPDAVLTRASRFLSGITASVTSGSSDGRKPPDPDDDRFATCLYVEADPATGALEVARAGHPDLAVRMADGTVMMRPTEGGLPLGVNPDADYPTTHFVLETGQTMLVCTDGLIETGGHDLETGWARIRSVLEAHHADGLEELADALVDAVHGRSSHYTPGPLPDRREDDIALLLLHRSGRTTRFTPARRTALTVTQVEPERIASARQQLRELLHDWADEEQIDSAALLASEMLTNVLVHTDGDALLVAELTGEKGRRVMRVEVTDRSDDLPHRRRPGELASSGRGLVLMELLADSWGVAPRGEGKAIWFELSEESGGHEPDLDLDQFPDLDEDIAAPDLDGAPSFPGMDGDGQPPERADGSGADGPGTPEAGPESDGGSG